MPDQNNDGTLVIVGVFDNEKLALLHKKDLESLNDTDDNHIVFYEILEYELNVPQDPRDFDDISEELQDLVSKGIVDYMIGEDGQFYFHLTDKGKDIVQGKPGSDSEDKQ